MLFLRAIGDCSFEFNQRDRIYGIRYLAAAV